MAQGHISLLVTRGYPLTRWVWVWAKFLTRHGYEFFNEYRYFSRVRVWDGKTQRVCTCCHLYLYGALGDMS
jgi:predicted DCC family thiol-disulfide oxidoreductase YuxK